METLGRGLGIKGFRCQGFGGLGLVQEFGVGGQALGGFLSRGPLGLGL